MAISKCSNQAARLTERVTFQEATEAKNAVHEIIKTWANLSTNPTVWASLVPVNGREYFDAHQTRSENFVRIKIRSRSDLTTKMQVVHGTTTYVIDYVPPYLAREAFMTLVCHVTS